VAAALGAVRCLQQHKRELGESSERGRRRAMQTRRNRNAAEQLEIRCDDLEAKAKKYSVYRLDEFYQSETFSSHQFSYDSNAKTIIWGTLS
jgi:hypothetical protein